MAIKVHLDVLLKRNNMTSKELCEKVGITEANMSLLRTGAVKGIRFSTLNKICYYLNCDVQDILQFDGQQEEHDEND
ncbi:MAG: helix-turn-helix transcriptional regulator [Erysipelotrichaceae bacterium]|nr:helix-turn-helix transcriptional regulator [Erysipelotrichaceae bacterium]MDP3304676.1 helix-turn-helix transcriptional regulator [Erysipelotrichaceae bacterium]